MHHSPSILLIPGTTSVAHLEENMKADRVSLDPGELETLARVASTVKPWRPEPPAEAPGALEGSPAGEHPNVATLRTLYADLTRLRDFAAEDVVLHAAERETPGGVKRVVGRDAVDAQERALIAMTDGTLVMDVQHIVANDHFGTVLGVLRGTSEGKTIAMPFCGVWRFRKGVILEHWENAYDVTRFFENLVAAGG
jgi:hypothetical protein